ALDAFADLDHSPRVRCDAVRLERNSGKGAAVRRGILEEATGQFRFFYDADASTPVEELGPALALLVDGFDLVIGSRALAASNVEVHQAWYREQMGKINNLLLKILG